MKSFRTSVVLTAALSALAWSGVSHAGDDAEKHKGTSGQGTSTTEPMGATQGSSSTEEDVDTTTSTGSTSTTTTTTTTGTGSPGSVYGSGSPTSTQPTTTQPMTTQPYQPYEQQQAPYQPPVYSTTTTTASQYDPLAGEDTEGFKYRPNRPLLITGAAIFAGTYAASTIVGAFSDTQGDDNLFIPVAGPWLDLADRECGLGDCGTREDVNQALIIGSGVAQGVGVGLAIASLFIPEERHGMMRSASARERSIATAKPTVKVMPISLRAGGGLGAMGTF